MGQRKILSYESYNQIITKTIYIKICGCRENSLYWKTYSLKYIDNNIRLNVKELCIQLKTQEEI